MKVYRNDEVFPLATCVTSKCSIGGTKMRNYNVTDIFRTYNSNRELVDIKYRLESSQKGGSIIETVRHENLKKHYEFEQREKYKKKKM